MEPVDIIRISLQHIEDGVLATIIHAEGHAYRKKGAFMLFLRDGRRYGTLSPGCLEHDLMDYVSVILDQRTAQVVEYDMRPEDDLSWGEQLGCGGYIRILLEPVYGELAEALDELNQELTAGRPMRWIRSFRDSYHPSSYLVLPAEFQEGPREVAESFEVLLQPKPRLILFGAGEDARPVAQLAQRAGFCVEIADFRSGLLVAEHYPGANLHYGFPAELMERLDWGADDYVIVMSHQFPRDQEFTRLVIEHPVKYLGILGSVTRTERLIDSPVPSWIHYPIGLNIGAEGPEEIAFSIVAELIQVRRRGGRGDGVAERHWDLLGRR